MSSTRRRTLIAGSVLAAVALSLVACSHGVATQRANGLTLMVPALPPSAVMEALISGTLAPNDSGCFTVESDGVTYPLQFPYGTELSGEGETLHVPGVPVLKVGDAIRGGGGYVHLECPRKSAQRRTSRTSTSCGRQSNSRSSDVASAPKLRVWCG